MIDALEDPYSSYLTSDEYHASLQGISGEFEGIGAEIATQAADGTQGCATLGADCRLVIVAPIAGSPAEKAGLRTGTSSWPRTASSLDGLTVDGARERIRGPKGTIVDADHPARHRRRRSRWRSSRDVIQQEEVESPRLRGRAVGYVRLERLLRSRRDGARGTRCARTSTRGGPKLILDLRGNPGGYVTAARAVASQFIGSGPCSGSRMPRATQVADRRAARRRRDEPATSGSSA